MSDLISRKAMLERLEEWNTSYYMDKALYNFTKSRINEQSSVDAVPVVRCVHCEYYFKHPLKFDSDEGHCVINGKIKTDDDYCSRGKKFGGGH